MSYIAKLDKQLHNFKYRKYYYNFDFIMHNYMLKKFKLFFNNNDCLELGAGNGNFTIKLAKFFNKITIVEGSLKSINKIKRLNIKNIDIINQDIEKINIKKKFNNIFIVHTLEHLKKRIYTLKKIKNLLTNKGILYVATPNANAISRQIAVKMGLIKKNNSITPGERSHGHQITYDLKKLEKDIIAAGFSIKESGGIFFKSLANFQIDLAVKKKIINQNYLDACYELGNLYNDFCSSIFVIAKKKNKFFNSKVF
jgi:2-polyprenyl-3-methyl-5-hydroxy-6-metoxy-1,4-benzoquinol methylase